MASDYAELQERHDEYYTADWLKTLHGTRVCRVTGDAGGICTGWQLKNVHDLRLCRVTGKAGGILHGWLTEDSTWYQSVQCYRRGRRNTNQLATLDCTWSQIMQSHRKGRAGVYYTADSHEDSTWYRSVHCYRKGRRNTTWMIHVRLYNECYRKGRRDTTQLTHPWQPQKLHCKIISFIKLYILINFLFLISGIVWEHDMWPCRLIVKSPCSNLPHCVISLKTQSQLTVMNVEHKWNISWDIVHEIGSITTIWQYHVDLMIEASQMIWKQVIFFFGGWGVGGCHVLKDICHTRTNPYSTTPCHR